MFKYYLEMALKGKYKDSMDEFTKQPHIKESITNEQTKKEIQTYLRTNVDFEITVRIFKRDKSKTFDSYYEIDLSPLYKNTGDHAALFKQAVADIKKHMAEKHISEHAYELLVKHVGYLDK